jgi:glucosamine 6-phosphate synthetase-like amidotransferase/phosphosugar isomerase protein
MSLGSMGNDDAFGLFNGKYSYKEKGLFNTKNVKKTLLYQDNFLIGHNRFTTKGHHKNNKNNHPFNINDFYLVHNGIISNHNELMEKYNLFNTIETDSFIIISLINKFFNKYEKKKPNREHNLLSSIKKTCELLEGSFSVFFYDRVLNNIYYFKDGSTHFYAYSNDKVLIGSTCKTNLNYTYLDNDLIRLKEYSDLKELKIDDGVIYLLNDKNTFKAVEKFDIKKSYMSYMSEGYGSSTYEDYYGKNLLNDFNFKDEDKEFKIDFIDNIFISYLDYIPEYVYDNKTDELSIKYDERIHSLLDGICIIDTEHNDNLLINLSDLVDFLGVCA